MMVNALTLMMVVVVMVCLVAMRAIDYIYR